jgi:hypothetical protein
VRSLTSVASRVARRPSAPHTLRLGRRRDRAIDALAGRLERVGLDRVLADLDREAVPAHVPGSAVRAGWSWDEHDRDDHGWVPQGVACARGGEVLLVSWYAPRRRLLQTAGSRISVVDVRDPARVRYRHVLLVRPRRPASVLGLGRVPVHAGGIAVVGDLLYVADTRAGVRLFRLDDVARADTRRLPSDLPGSGAWRALRAWRSGGDGTAAPVLPELVRVRQGARPGQGAFRWSFIGTARVDGRLGLVVGEYGRKGTTPRLARYPLDEATGLPELDATGRWTPVEVHQQQPHRMQGVALDGTTWVLSSSTGEGNPGDLYVGRPGAFTRYKGVLPTGPEDLDWSRRGEELWCVSEWPGRRWLFTIAVPRG